MEKNDYIANLRYVSRKLVRELGMLELNNNNAGRTPSHWHALIEINGEQGITISKLSNLLLLSLPVTSRIVDTLVGSNLVQYREGVDKRQKKLYITEKAKNELSNIEDFSNLRVKGALRYLNIEEQQQIFRSIEIYSNALELSRIKKEEIKVLKLSTSRLIRKKIISMIEEIQTKEFSVEINDEINSCILKAEEHFHYNNECNFWYATNADAEIIGSIGLKKIDENKAEIKKFFVKQEYRGYGVAQKLFSKLVLVAEKHKFNSLYLGTVDKLKAAQRFYEKRGFMKISKNILPKNFEICPVDTVFFHGLIENVKATLY
ncbi:MAG: GNAT family N-acetyltransferase [Alphaproteobacteria bacterium]